MLAKLIDLCLEYRPVVLLLTLIVCVLGVVSFRELPFDAFPDTTPIQVQINTTAPALSPLEIERQITFEVEQSISGLPGLVDVRSVSKFGFSQIVAIFDDDTDIYLARQNISERLGATDLPNGVDPPSLGPVATGLGEVFQYVLTSDELSAQELRTLHHWVIRPQMVQVSGVAEINSWGGYEKQFHVILDPQKLIAREITLDEVARALKSSNRNVGGGVLNQGGESLLIQGNGLATTREDLRGVVLANVDGTLIRLRDVAEVTIGHELRRGAVTAQGRGEAVLGLGFMLMGENSREVTQKLGERLAQVQRSLPKSVKLEPVYRRTDLVDQVLLTVRDNLLEGALLVIAILFLMLGNLRAGFIVALAIPLSMLFAFNAMSRFGIIGSLMSLGAIDFGLVVDSSVIMIENASRRLAEDTSERSVVEIVRDAAIEVRKPTLFGELIIAVVYLPILALEGVEGRLFRPMALTVIFALIGSMLISMTLMPVLASYVLKKGGGHGDNRLMRALKRAYSWVLERALGVPKLVLLVAAVMVLNAGWLASTLGSEFVPRLREQAVVINTVRIAGISLEESSRYGTRIEQKLLRAFPDEIEHIWTRTGTAEVATDPMGLEVSDVFITLTPRSTWTRGKTQDAITSAMRVELEGMPGMRAIFTQPIEMRVNEMLAGIRADVGVKIFGDDFAQLQSSAEDVRAAIESIEGATDVTVEQLTGQAMLSIQVDREAAGRYGVPVADVLATIESLGTRKVGEVVQGQRRFDLVLRLNDASRTSPKQLESLLIRTASGARIPLGEVSKIEIIEGPSSIQREWAKRRVTVQANVQGRDLGGFVTELREVLRKNVSLPEGYYTTLGGEFENLDRASKRLAVVIPITLLLVFSLLYLTYGRFSDAIRVFTGVPFGAVGGILALWMRDLPLSVSAAVGFIALSGVAVLGDIVLVSRIKAHEASGMPMHEAVQTAAVERLRPVLMTSLVAALGFVPMALNTGVGAEVQRPIATVVVGGMLSATIATLLVLPVLYTAFARSSDAKEEPEDATEELEGATEEPV